MADNPHKNSVALYLSKVARASVVWTLSSHSLQGERQVAAPQPPSMKKRSTILVGLFGFSRQLTHLSFVDEKGTLINVTSPVTESNRTMT